VPNFGPADIEAMRAANERFADALRRADVDGALAADDAFHAVAVDVCANHAVRSVLEEFTPVLRRVERLRFGSLSGRDSIAQHARIIELSAEGDAAAAAAMARANWLTLTPVLKEY
jgi:DNA-binding GntR family transcriptional regulator